MDRRTDPAPERETGGEIVHLGAGRERPAPIDARVDGMTVKVRKITTTDEGRLQVVLETEGMDDAVIGQVKSMLTLQQSCLVRVTMTPVQRDLFDA
jgi:hypothetical protein